MRNNGVEVRYFIDRNAAYLKEDIPVYPLRGGLPSVDLILISLVESIKDITKELKMLTEEKICSIVELLAEIREED